MDLVEPVGECWPARLPRREVEHSEPTREGEEESQYLPPAPMKRLGIQAMQVDAGTEMQDRVPSPIEPSGLHPLL